MFNCARAHSIVEGHIGGGFIVTLPGSEKKLRYCGLLDTLRAACYPKYDFSRARSAAKIPKAQLLKTGLSRPWHGRQRGDLVHKQLRAAVNVGRDAIRGMYKRETPLVTQFLASLRAKRLEPVQSEFADYFEHLQLASAFDLLCTRVNLATGREQLVIVELKCGYDNGFRDGVGPLKNPPELRHYNDSPLTQAYLQLAFYRLMVERHYPAVDIGPCYVAQVTNTKTVYYRLPDDIVNASNSLLSFVGAARQHKQRARATTKAKKAAAKRATAAGKRPKPRVSKASGSARR